MDELKTEWLNGFSWFYKYKLGQKSLTNLTIQQFKHPVIQVVTALIDGFSHKFYFYYGCLFADRKEERNF